MMGLLVSIGGFGLPETFFINSDGKILYKHVGPITKKDLDKISKILEKNETFYYNFFLIFNTEFVGSVEPDEILENPELEEIAKEIGRNLRCLVCQNEDIENSNLDIAKDLRMLVRKKTY